MANYDSIIQSAAQKYNVDPALIRAVIQTESSGNPSAKSDKGAVGLGQLMPATAKSLGVSDPKDPAQAIPAIAALLDQNLSRYGNVQDALRAYHGGTDTKNWGDLTQAYPGKVMANMQKPAQQMLPGIPVSQSQNGQSDDDIFAAFSGGKKPSQAQPGASDDQIFSAFTQQKPATQQAQQQAAQQVPSGIIGSLQSAGAGAGKAFGEGVLGLQSLVGRGINAVGGAFAPAPTMSGLVTGQQPQNAVQRAGQWLINDAAQGRAKLEAENAPYAAAAPISNVGGQIVGTLAPGAAVAKSLGSVAGLGARAIGAETAAAPLIQAISTGGASSGGLGGLAGLGARAAGGAITGAGMGALYSPENIGTSAAIGGTVPIIGAGLGAAGRYSANVVRSLVQPFTKAGQQEIAENILYQVAKGGPNAMNAAEIIPGSAPTLAESTGNPGIATLQRTIRDLNPNPFVEREASNAAARLNAFEDVAGDSSKLDFFRASRETAANDLYGQAMKNYTGENVTPWVKGQITQLLKRDSITEARKIAQQWAIERGEKPSFAGSMEGMHDVKTALDDMIGKAVRNGENGQARVLQKTKDKLLMVLEKMSPEYAEARTTYAEMSKPVNAMEALQGLNVTDQYGNITLSKIQNAINGLNKRIARPGVDTAKSITADQLGVLNSIRDDLLRQSQTGAGRSAGSATGQNLAMQNVLRNALPGKLGSFAASAPEGAIGGATGAGLGFAIGGPVGAAAGAPIGATTSKLFNALLRNQNEKINANLANMLLNSPQGLAALQGAASRAAPGLKVASPLQRLLQPGAVGSLMELNRPPAPITSR